MPDVNALYPAPPPAPQQGSSLLANPGQAIGLANGINQLKLFNAQFPALAQQPAAALQGQNISNETAEQQQQEAASRAVSRIMGGYLAGIPENKRTPDDVRSAAAFAARSLPNVAIKYPGIITAASKTGQENPGLLINSGLSPESQSSRVDVTDPNTGAKFSAPVTSANMGGVLPTSLPAGGNESALARQSDLKTEGDTYSNDVNNLRQALHYAQALPKGSTGPLAEKFNDFKARMVELGILPQKDAENLSNFQQLQKYVARSVSDRANSVGPHTNDGLASALSGTPNAHMTDLALEPLLKASLAVRHMQHAAVMNSSTAPVGEYVNEKAKFGTKQDPRAYAIETMTPDEIKNLDKSLKPSERATFNKSYAAAIQAGILKRPGE